MSTSTRRRCDVLPVAGAIAGRHANGPGGAECQLHLQARADTTFGATTRGRLSAIWPKATPQRCAGKRRRPPAPLGSTRTPPAAPESDRRGRERRAGNRLRSPARWTNSTHGGRAAADIERHRRTGTWPCHRRDHDPQPAPGQMPRSRATCSVSPTSRPERNRNSPGAARLPRRRSGSRPTRSVTRPGRLVCVCRQLGHRSTVIVTMARAGAVSHPEANLRGDETACYRIAAAEAVSGRHHRRAGDAFIARWRPAGATPRCVRGARASGRPLRQPVHRDQAGAALAMLRPRRFLEVSGAPYNARMQIAKIASSRR